MVPIPCRSWFGARFVNIKPRGIRDRGTHDEAFISTTSLPNVAFIPTGLHVDESASEENDLKESVYVDLTKADCRENFCLYLDEP